MGFVQDMELGFTLERSEARSLVEVGERIKLAPAEQLPSMHPDNPSIHTVNQTLFAGPVTLEEGVKSQKTLWSFHLAESTAVLVVRGAPREWL
jgi:proline racemase